MGRRLRNGWSGSVAVLLVAFAATALLYATRGWIWLGVPPIGPERVPFSDAAAQLSAADACTGGAGQWVHGVCFLPSPDIEVHSQTYEPWLAFQRIGLTGSLYRPTAFVLIGIFYLAMTLSFRPRSAREAGVLLLLLFSAAVQLAVERANFDLLTASLLCLAALLLAARRPTVALLGCLVLGFDTSLKLYTGISSALAWIVRRGDRGVLMLASAASTAAAMGVLGLDNIFVLDHGAPQGETRFSTGAHWLLHSGAVGWTIAAAVVALVAFLVSLRALHEAPGRIDAFARYPRRTALFQIAFLTAIPLFLLKDSYDYRLVLWLPCLSLPAAWLHDRSVAPHWRRLGILIIAFSLIVLYAEFPCSWIERWVRHGGPRWALHAIHGIVIAKQLATWLVAALLSALFAFSPVGRSAAARSQRAPSTGAD